MQDGSARANRATSQPLRIADVLEDVFAVDQVERAVAQVGDALRVGEPEDGDASRRRQLREDELGQLRVYEIEIDQRDRLDALGTRPQEVDQSKGEPGPIVQDAELRQPGAGGDKRLDVRAEASGALKGVAQEREQDQVLLLTIVVEQVPLVVGHEGSLEILMGLVHVLEARLAEDAAANAGRLQRLGEPAPPPAELRGLLQYVHPQFPLVARPLARPDEAAQPGFQPRGQKSLDVAQRVHLRCLLGMTGRVHSTRTISPRTTAGDLRPSGANRSVIARRGFVDPVHREPPVAADPIEADGDEDVDHFVGDQQPAEHRGGHR